MSDFTAMPVLYQKLRESQIIHREMMQQFVKIRYVKKKKTLTISLLSIFSLTKPLNLLGVFILKERDSISTKNPERKYQKDYAKVID